MAAAQEPENECPGRGLHKRLQKKSAALEIKVILASISNTHGYCVGFDSLDTIGIKLSFVIHCMSVENMNMRNSMCLLRVFSSVLKLRGKVNKAV